MPWKSLRKLPEVSGKTSDPTHSQGLSDEVTAGGYTQAAVGEHYPQIAFSNLSVVQEPH